MVTDSGAASPGEPKRRFAPWHDDRQTGTGWTLDSPRRAILSVIPGFRSRRAEWRAERRAVTRAADPAPGLSRPGALLILNALTYYPGLAFLPIPSAGQGRHAGGAGGGAPPALALNRRLTIRPNVFLCLISLLVLEAPSRA